MGSEAEIDTNNPFLICNSIDSAQSHIKMAMNQCIRSQFCIWISGTRKAHPQPKQLDLSWRAERLGAEFSNHAGTCCRKLRSGPTGLATWHMWKKKKVKDLPENKTNISPFIIHKIINHQLPITFTRFKLDMHMIHTLFFHS